MAGIAGIILAGGRSSRMGGGDKCRLMLGGVSLVARVAERIAPQVDALAISAGDEPNSGYGLAYPILIDTVTGKAGPLAGLLAGLEWAADGGFTWLLSVPCDIPFVPSDLARRLCEAAAGKELALASSNGRSHHVIGLWPVSIAPALRQRMTEDGLREVGVLARSYRVGLAVWPSTPYDPFHNINQPEDLAAARRILEEFAS